MNKSATDNFRREDNAASEYLVELGARVRAARARHGMTRKILANDSGVSERYLAKLESGQGNVSVLVLRQIADAMDMKMSDLIVGAEQMTPERQMLYQLARRLPEDKLAEALKLIRAQIGESPNDAKGKRISLIGLRGAGKSTLGPLLAGRLGFGFIELNKKVEKEFGASLAEIFSLAGQPSFRRLERRCLTNIIDRQDEVVIATGGSIVADEKTFSLLLRRTHVIWLQASPEEHMARVMAQGDMRPMAGSSEAMEDLKQILVAREPLYRRADARFSTAGQQIEQSLQKLEQITLSLLDGGGAQSA
ncbi:helix-turn-helix transcriptional regulator [Sneathiella sp.]|uniref:helix-turn-helix transcriptional regulator n=1 Tax=Sneathiella sp. TaxID=1964365 RepID=UPI003563E9BA